MYYKFYFPDVIKFTLYYNKFDDILICLPIQPTRKITI